MKPWGWLGVAVVVVVIAFAVVASQSNGPGDRTAAVVTSPSDEGADVRGSFESASREVATDEATGQARQEIAQEVASEAEEAVTASGPAAAALDPGAAAETAVSTASRTADEIAGESLEVQPYRTAGDMAATEAAIASEQNRTEAAGAADVNIAAEDVREEWTSQSKEAYQQIAKARLDALERELNDLRRTSSQVGSPEQQQQIEELSRQLEMARVDFRTLEAAPAETDDWHVQRDRLEEALNQLDRQLDDTRSAHLENQERQAYDQRAATAGF